MRCSGSCFLNDHSVKIRNGQDWKWGDNYQRLRIMVTAVEEGKHEKAQDK